MRTLHQWNFAAAALGLVFAAAGCAPTTQPFQARGNTLVGYGYSEVKNDPTHYSVSYSDIDAKIADSRLELRAAQLAQGDGYHYFIVDGRDDTVVKHVENDLNFNMVPQHNTAGSGAGRNIIQPRDLVPNVSREHTTSYYYALGKVVLLTDDQARGNTKAVPVSQVLAGSLAAP